MMWNQYLADTGHAIQKGLTGGLHLLEGTLATAATLKGGYELATAIGTGIRGMAAAAGPAAAVALL
jgi:hypothetical protein